MMTGTVVLLALCTLCGVNGGLPPKFSWDRLPVYFHSSNRTGMWNDTALEIIARYPWVTIEKWHQYADPTNHQTEDQRIIGQCRAIKKVKKDISCMFYTNAAIDFEWYAINKAMVDHPGWALRTETGKPVKITSRTVFDFSNDACASRFEKMCSDALDTGVVDGCFVDRSDVVWPHQEQWPLAHNVSEAYSKNKADMLRSLQKKAGDGPIIMNCHGCIDNRSIPSPPWVNTQNIEWFRNDNESINTMLFLQQHSTILRAHAEVPDDHIGDAMGAFLIAAKVNSFFGTGGFWAAPTWRPEYDRPLGAPVADATYDSATQTWSRKFSKGTSVKFDCRTNTSVIVW
eukprot:NODE_3847_length_1154_cov_69.018429_g3660_i0.p1 GENE.NODE_3847_length_1154_cov_69.018429_g3660_i0~~NODE_3847_length_1154_cov_69.018429_g3660_i0.p1  ORF type:complete len:361 (-),score=56.12 NODE_3847_length_1154_cov_69.018429_g3660_i0:70-1098(-)